MTSLRGEVPFPKAGEGAFLQFTITDLVELEDEYGQDFFQKIELAVQNSYPKILARCVCIGMKTRPEGGHAKRLYKGINDLDNVDYHVVTDTGMELLNAVSLAVSTEDYESLLKNIAQAEQDMVNKAAKSLKEASEEAGAPFTEEALVNAILKSGIVPA